MTFKLSPSSLNLMNECERCFWLDKHNVWKRPSGILIRVITTINTIENKIFGDGNTERKTSGV